MAVRVATPSIHLDPGLHPLLKEVGEVPPRPFVPARFQVEALEAVQRGNVFVAAPTGSGKTWIAERAIDQLQARGGTAWYTTPLKALSNQKFHRRIPQEEIFGPVVAVIKARDFEDALVIANSTEYGLTGSGAGQTPRSAAPITCGCSCSQKSPR